MTPEVCGQLLLGPRGALGLLAVGGGVTARLGRTERMARPATAEAPGRMGGRVVGWMMDDGPQDAHAKPAAQREPALCMWGAL